MPDFKIVTAVDYPRLSDENSNMARIAWPEFMLHDPVSNLFTDLYQHYPQYQFGLIDPISSELRLIGNSIPLRWDNDLSDLPDEGWDWALTRGIEDCRAGQQPNVLCAIQVMIPPSERGHGLSAAGVKTMREIGLKNGLANLIAPVRPNRKPEFPHLSMDEYIEKTNDDGLPFDPWLRVHLRLGGRIIKPCHNSMRITGTIVEWSQWADMEFSSSGEYAVPGALAPITIDLENDLGIYVEPNVWMVHEN